MLRSLPRKIDRRATPRLAAVERDARIAWREGVANFLMAHVRLVDIGPGGARLIGGPSVPTDRTVWVHLEALRWEWVRATVVANGVDWGGRRFHLAFGEPCTAGLMEAATRAVEPLNNGLPGLSPMSFSFGEP